MISYYGNYRTRTFNDIFPDLATFTTWYGNGMFPAELTNDNKAILYYSLVARYGNSHIANSDENQFKVNLLYITFKYGPNWQKELSIQSSLRQLSDAQIQEGSEAIHNTASNPGEIPVSGSSVIGTDGKLTYIQQQNTTKFKKSPLEGYAILEELLKKDVTNAFIEKFKDLFLKIVFPELPLYYTTEEDED